MKEFICKSKVEGIDNAYILVSGQKREIEGAENLYLAKATVSFVYDSGEYAAEWEPEYGPIQVWHKCDESAEAARPHYFYDFTDSQPGNWSQLAVERLQLPEAFVQGRF